MALTKKIKIKKIKWPKITAAYLEAFNSGLFKLNCIAQKSKSKIECVFLTGSWQYDFTKFRSKP
jgi:hypothetical protein